MATDKLIHDFSTHFPDTVANFLRAAKDKYEAKSVIFKEIERQADLFLIGRSGQNVMLMETQGYPKEDLFHHMVKKLMLFCTQYKYWGNMEATAIFLDESHYRAAGLFEKQFGQSTLLRFTPKVFVFSRIKVNELSQLNDIHLIPLYPLCDVSPEEITQHAPVWAEQIKTAPDLTDDERQNLLSFLGGAISHRIKTMTKNEISNLFGGFNMEDTPVGQEILRIGEQRGELRGEQRGEQRMLLKQIAARFGTVPEDIRQRIQTIQDTENLEQIATLLLTIQSVDELKNLVN